MVNDAARLFSGGDIAPAHVAMSTAAPASARRAPVILSVPSFVALAAMVLIAAAPIVLSASLVPRAAVLPVLSLSAFAVSVPVALAAGARNVPRHVDGVTLWDIAGALVLIGCAASVLADPLRSVEIFTPL